MDLLGFLRILWGFLGFKVWGLWGLGFGWDFRVLGCWATLSPKP